MSSPGCVHAYNPFGDGLHGTIYWKCERCDSVVTEDPNEMTAAEATDYLQREISRELREKFRGTTVGASRRAIAETLTRLCEKWAKEKAIPVPDVEVKTDPDNPDKLLISIPASILPTSPLDCPFCHFEDSVDGAHTIAELCNAHRPAQITQTITLEVSE